MGPERIAAELRTMLEASPDAMLAVDSRGVIVAANARAETMFAFEPGTLAGQAIEALVPESVRAQHVEHRERYFQQPTTRPMAAGLPLKGRRRDGTEFPVEISLGPMTRDGSTIVLSAIRDVSEQRRTDARFRVLLEAAPDAMIISDSQGQIVLVNAQTERLFGYPREELTGRPVEILIPPRYRDSHVRHRAGFGRSPGTRPMGMGLELFGCRRDGTEFPVEISLSPLVTEEGRFAVAAVRDISERKQIELARAQLEQEQAARKNAEEANRLKDEFLATLSHELRTPLTAIVGWASMLRRKQLDPAMSEKALEAIERNAAAQTQLIGDILDISRIAVGKLRIAPEVINVADIAEAAITTVSPSAKAKAISVRPHIEPTGAVVHGDAARLQQVLWNLLSNAIKFTPRGGIVDVTVRSIHSVVEVRVTDTGIGIRADFLPHVFDMFRQGDASSTRAHGGLGLGLAIVRRLVELHGGTVAVESAGQGAGTTFTVHLPRAAISADLSPRAGSDPKVSAARLLHGVRVAVVEDDEDSRELITTVIQHAGASVLPAANAKDGFQLIVQSRPDVLVSDIEMPGGSGYDLIRRVRALPADGGGMTPALALTAYASPEDRLRALSAGFEAHLAKPVAPDTLTNAVATLAGIRRP
jgi:PAS domain S-box-containing protein